jgi:hypothetical protein
MGEALIKITDTYEGPATLILPDDTRIDVAASFETAVEQIDVPIAQDWARGRHRYVDGMKSWHGTAMGGTAPRRMVGHLITVELPNAVRGEAYVMAYVTDADGKATWALQGQGRAPYDMA